MSAKAKKLYQKWSSQIPVEAKINDIRTFLDFYFAEQWDHEGSSHIIIRCEKLKLFEEFKPYGEICVPVKSGRLVKGRYIRNILKGLEFLKAIGEDVK